MTLSYLLEECLRSRVGGEELVVRRDLNISSDPAEVYGSDEECRFRAQQERQRRPCTFNSGVIEPSRTESASIASHMALSPGMSWVTYADRVQV